MTLYEFVLRRRQESVDLSPQEEKAAEIQGNAVERIQKGKNVYVNLRTWYLSVKNHGDMMGILAPDKLQVPASSRFDKHGKVMAFRGDKTRIKGW